MSVRSFFSELHYAVRRVSNEYQDASNVRGDRTFQVTITLHPLEREQSQRLYERIVKAERISEDRHNRSASDELAARKLAKLVMTVENFSNASAALTAALDILRDALHEEKLADVVTMVTAQAEDAV